MSQISIAEQTYYRWCKHYGGMGPGQLKELKRLQKENERLRRGVSEHRICRVLGEHRQPQRHVPRGQADETRLVVDMIEFTRQYGRYGYRRIAALLRDVGWQVNDKRIWKRAGLKVPSKQPKKGRLWLNDRSCVQLRPRYRDHVWSYDFVHHRTDDGRAFRTLNHY
jgi:putative transposase